MSFTEMRLDKVYIKFHKYNQQLVSDQSDKESMDVEIFFLTSDSGIREERAIE